METHRRRQVILTLLEERGEVAVDELAVDLGVSENTIRNDLNALADEALVRRVRGGAVAVNGGSTRTKTDFTVRANRYKRAKELMGRWAARMVQDGDAIVLDASSTVYYVAKNLLDRQNLTVVTNGLETAVLLAQNSTNRVILAADQVRSHGYSIVGDFNPRLLHHFSPSRIFVSCTGLTVKLGLMELDIDEGPLKAQMVKLGGQIIALVDHSKFDRVNTYRFADLKQISHLVIDDGIPADQLQALREAGACPVTVVGETSEETFSIDVSSSAERVYRIGFANLTERIVFAQQVRRSLERATKQHTNVELLVRDNDLDRQQAFDNAAWFVDNAVDLVVEFQIDSQAGNIIMDTLRQAGIPVIAVDIAMPGATFFGADNYRAGFIAGEALGCWIQEHWQGHLDVLLKLEMTEVGAASSARLLGQQIGLESTLGFLGSHQIITIDIPGFLEETVPLVKAILPNLSLDANIGIVGLNDEVVLGGLEAFEHAGRLSQVVAVGQGADRLGRAALRRPGFPFIASTRYAPERYGEQLLELALKILRGEAVPPAVTIEHILITRDNVEEYYPAAKDAPIDSTRSL